MSLGLSPQSGSERRNTCLEATASNFFVCASVLPQKANLGSIMAPSSRHAYPASPQSPEQSDLPLPRSPESLSQGEVFASPYPNTVTTDTLERVRPGTLHLKPVTWESIAEINFPPGERFEIVDGLLVWLPMGNGTEKHQRIIRVLAQLITLLRMWKAVSCLDVEVESISGNPQAANSRSPDVSITRRRPGSPTDSSSGSEQRPKKHVLHTKEKPAYALIEVTSASTRATDLTAKWQQYRATGVRFYYIIDLCGYETFRKSRVIVGSKEPIEGWTRCENGDPDGASSSTSTQPHRSSYYKKIYTENDVVDVGVFQDQPLTASQLMSFSFLNQRVEEIKQQNESKDGRIADLSQQNANLTQQNESKDGRIADLSQQNANLSRQVDDLLRKNASLPQGSTSRRREPVRERGSSSNLRPDKERTRKNNKPNSSSHRQSAASQPTSPTNSPEKKRHKRKK